MVIIESAPLAFKLLKGLVCIYKPAGISCFEVRKRVIGNLCQDLCELHVRPAQSHVYIEGDPLKELTVSVGPNYADHPLVVGPHYQEEDITCNWATFLGKNTSGVLLIGLLKGTAASHKIHETFPIRTYHIKGILGQATTTCFTDGKVMEKASFRHVKKTTVDRVLSSIQASHQRLMFEQLGLDVQSQAAYELAAQGPIRPSSKHMTIMYGIKCIEFVPPNFTIEINCVNEKEVFLTNIIHEIGIKLHSAATCSAVRCVRHSLFNLEHALLRKHWRLQYIINNRILCENIINNSSHLQNTIPRLQTEPITEIDLKIH